MLSVIIPARNEVYLQKTIDSVLSAAEGDIEVIAICDGYKPDPPLRADDKRVSVIYNETAIGQRHAINQGARVAKGDYILKTDGHSMFDQGFDVKLAADCEYDWTVLPRMYTLDAEKWEPKLRKRTDFMFFRSPFAEVKPLRIDYWDAKTAREFPDEYRAYKTASFRKGNICDVMTGQGACFFMHKGRFWDLGGMDEGHGHWGQMGVELACKAWLSGGRQVVNKNTWFSHLFRKKSPWPASGTKQEFARKYSIDLWSNNRWEGQKYPLSWLIEKFSPVPTWNGDIEKVSQMPKTSDLTLLYYTANRINGHFRDKVLDQLRYACPNAPIVSVSQKPMTLGQNICVGEIGASLQNIYKQVLAGARKVKTEYVALVEDDCLYVPEHFNHRPKDHFAYNINRWLLHADSEPHQYSYRNRPILSQCIAPTKLLVECLDAREKAGTMDTEYGEPGMYEKDHKLKAYPCESFETKEPNVVLAHNKNTSGRRYVGKDAEPRMELAPWGDAGQLLQTLGLTPEVAGTTILYYSCNTVPFYFERVITAYIKKASGDRPIISVTHKPLKFGKNICVGKLKRCDNSIFEQILRGAEEATTTYVALAESDCLYTDEHFNFIPPTNDTFYYNKNNWWGYWNGDKRAKYSYVKRKALSQLICNRKLLIRAMKRNLELNKNGFKIRKGISGACEPGARSYKESFVGAKSAWDTMAEQEDFKSEYFETKLSNVDIRHSDNLNQGRRGSKVKKDSLEPWGKFFPFMQKEVLKRWRSRYGLKMHKILNVDDLHNNRVAYAKRGGEKSVAFFNEVFPPFVKQIHEGVTFTNEDFEKQPYFKYLVSKLNRADRSPLTGKGKRHVFKKMQDVINLYNDIKQNGLRNPIEAFRDRGRLCIDRGGRRAEILWALGYKTAPARVYANELAYRSLAAPPDLQDDNSINAIAMRQFGKLQEKATDKYWIHQYLFDYDRHIGHLRPKADKVLEIGIARGSSLLMWEEAFPKAHIYGMDVNTREPWKSAIEGHERISVLMGKQEDEKFLTEKVIPEGPFDLIIDDGSHHPPGTKKTFEVLWPQVKPRGWYVIEDLCGNYRPDRIMYGTTVDMVKNLVDEMNMTAQVRSVHFYYNIAFIEKTR